MKPRLMEDYLLGQATLAISQTSIPYLIIPITYKARLAKIDLM